MQWQSAIVLLYIHLKFYFHIIGTTEYIIYMFYCIGIDAEVKYKEILFPLYLTVIVVKCLQRYFLTLRLQWYKNS